MPCMCWYTPSDENHKIFKEKCQNLISFIKHLEDAGDPTSCTLEDAIKLLKHLYNPSECLDSGYNNHSFGNTIKKND